MKILVFGRGVIGTLYGWAFERAGHEVTFFVRPGRTAEYGPSIALDFLDARRRLWGERVVDTLAPRYCESLAEDHDYDLIVLSVQHYRFADAAAYLATRVSRATLLVFNNFFVEPTDAVAALPASSIVWGFPLAGGGFDRAGVLRGALLPMVQVGVLAGERPTERAHAVRRLFRETGFGLIEQKDFRAWLFVHFAVNAGLFAQVCHTGSVEAFLASGTARADAIRTIRETLAIAEAKGVDVGAFPFDAGFARLSPTLAGALLGFVLRHFPPARVILEAHTNPEDFRRTAEDTLAEARRLGVAVPRLEALVTT